MAFFDRLFLLLGLVLAVVPGCAAPKANSDSILHVTEIIDGDTIKLSDGRKVRLLRVDTPERGEPGFFQSAAALESMLSDSKPLRLEFEEEKLDRHGRTLAYLWVGEKQINLEMVRSGWSPFYDDYGTGRYAPQFRRAEAEARRQHIGIWSRK